MNQRGFFFVLLGACLFSSFAMAGVNSKNNSGSDSLQGITHFLARLRYEDVAQGIQGAQGLTLRSRFSYKTPSYHFFSGLLEFENITAIPNDENYNSGSNQQFDDLLIQDPVGTEVSRVWLAYDVSNTLIKFGRQKVSLNNERLVGADSFRQNEQSFSGVSVLNQSLNLTRISLAQLNSVQGVGGKKNPLSHSEINAKLLNIQYRGILSSKLTFYGLWLKNHPLQTQWETNTYGSRFEGETGDEAFSIDYVFEYARQEDTGKNTLNYQANYSLMELDFGRRGYHIKLGREILGADGDGFFVTPLASLHDFQGENDQFVNQGLGNIHGGIKDQYAKFTYSYLKNLSFSTIYHDFKSSEPNGSGNLGHEWGVKVDYKHNKYQFIASYADYTKHNFGNDNKKVWLTAELSL